MTGVIDPREKFRLKKKTFSLKSKTPLVIMDESGERIQGIKKSTRSPSTPGFEVQLHNAVMLDDIEGTRTILEIGSIKINDVDPNGVSVLHRACTGGNIDIVKLLVEAGADIYLPNKNGHTALNIAVRNGHFDLSQYLIEKGAKSEEIKDGVKNKYT